MLQQIIDRRLAGKNKSIGNRERFLRRYQGQLRDAVRKAVDKRGIRDIERLLSQLDFRTLKYHSHSSRTCLAV